MKPITPQPYMQEAWYSTFAAACQASSGAEVARRMGVSEPLVYQVLRGKGAYGTGAASTARFAQKVLHQLGRYPCPHLTEQAGEERVITADQCRAYAHRSAPVSSPRELAHWQACRQCPHKGLAAPAEPRTPQPRRKAAPAAAPITTPANPQPTEQPATAPKENP